MSDLTARQLRYGLLAIYALHLIILSLYTFDIIPQEFHRDGYPFWFHHGSDDYHYVALADNIINLHFDANKYPLGFPLTLTPFMAVLNTHAHDDLLQPVAFFWGVLMFPIGQWLLAWIGERVTRRRWLALVGVLIWTLLPLIVFGMLRLVSNSTMAETYSVHLTWAQMLSDGPSTLLTLLIFACLIRLRETDFALRWIVLLGLLSGYLIMVRYVGALTVGVAGLLLLLQHRWKAAIVMGVCALIIFVPQMAYNWHFFDSPFRTGYTVLDTVPTDGLFALSYLSDGFDKVWNRAGLLLIPASIAALAGTITALRYLWRQDHIDALMVAGWAGSYVAVFALYYYSWVGGLMRFLLPALPAFALLAAAAIGEIVRYDPCGKFLLKGTAR